MEEQQVRVLFIATPFENLVGGDKNRSRFLWESLSASFEADLALISNSELAAGNPEWKNWQPVARFEALKGPRHRPAAIPRFSSVDRGRFRELLRSQRYSIVFGCFTTAWELLREVGRTIPEAQVVVDVYMLSSRLVGLSWAAAPSLRRRWYLLEQWKLLAFEQVMFRQPWSLLFTNPNELSTARRRVRGDESRFHWIPNPMMSLGRPKLAAHGRKVLLFFGVMRSSGNSDAYHYLRDDILPLIADDLDEFGVVIEVAGAGAPPEWQHELDRAGEHRIRIVGRVESMEATIAESLAVILPQRVAAGTLTRVSEAAAQQRAVVTTSCGCDGLGLESQLLIGDSPERFAAQVRRVLGSAKLRSDLGRELREAATERYAPSVVSRLLVELLRGLAAVPR